MGDSRERSEAPRARGLPPRCRCGFWGSSKTMNLCSKCFADVQKKQPGEDDCPSPSSPPLQSSSSQSRSSSLPPEQPSTDEPSGEETGRGTLRMPTKHLRDADSGSECEVTLEKRLRLEDKVGLDASAKQKNRRRCFRCQTKLELVQQELGSCRCGFVFCMQHRLPEQHDCLFDHLGRGRQDAILKMVKLERKVGRSCQRIGEECS
ncbi:unnamed protein product [Ophioblennius macclurei]